MTLNYEVFCLNSDCRWVGEVAISGDINLLDNRRHVCCLGCGKQNMLIEATPKDQAIKLEVV